MKLERLHESVLPSIALLSGLSLAIVAGFLAGNGQTGSVMMLMGAIAAVAFLLIVRQRMWMLIPATWMLSGKISVLPVPFSIAQTSILFAFGTYLLLKAFKVIRLRPKFDLVDTWMSVVLVYLLMVFIRNPVGVEALGSDRVGGRPYVDVIIAFLAFWVLRQSVASPREAFFVPLLGVVGHGFHAVLNAIAYRFPSTVGPLSRLYSGIGAAENPDALPPMPGEEASRLSYLQGLGVGMFAYACARWRPFTLLNPLKIGRFLIFAFAVFAVLQSGFRSALIGLAQWFLLSTYFRRGVPEVGRVMVLGAVGIALLVAVQGTLINLPLPMQRTLSFLPGQWDYAAKSDAKGSTEWRVEMWKTMLTGNKYIANKWFGDGFGFTRRQLEIMSANRLTGGTADQQENIMIGGGVHSGPVSSIRYVGYVGLILFLIFVTLIAIRGVRLIRRSQDTPHYTLALMIGIPSVLFPFNFIFIFGAFEGDLPNALFACGMQKLLENSLDAYEASQKKATEPVEAKQRIQPRRPRYAPVGHLG